MYRYWFINFMDFITAEYYKKIAKKNPTIIYLFIFLCIYLFICLFTILLTYLITYLFVFSQQSTPTQSKRKHSQQRQQAHLFKVLLGGKRYVPCSTLMTSQTPIIGQCHSDWQGRNSNVVHVSGNLAFTARIIAMDGYAIIETHFSEEILNILQRTEK